jgi:CheY-like chemotaxis protein
MRILLVEDDPDLLEIMSHVVTGSFGIEVDGHTGSASAIKALETSAYDCVIYDVQIPGPIDGLGLLDVTRRQPLNARAVSVLMSGNPHLQDDVTRVGLDAVHLLIKPFTPDDLATLVGRILGLPKPTPILSR